MRYGYGFFNFLKFSGVCLILLSFASSLYAQRHTTARNLALGGGGTAYIDDFHANFINPANLMLNDQNVTFGLMGGLSTSAGGRLADFGIYDQYFTRGRNINEDLVLEISEKLYGSQANSIRQIGFNLDVVPLGMSIISEKSAISAAYRVRMMSSFKASKGLFELALGGFNQQFFNEYKDVSLRGDFMTVGEISVGYAREVWSEGSRGEPGSSRLIAGIAPKYRMGYDYYNATFDSKLSISEDEMLVSHIFNYRFETAGVVSEQLNDFVRDRNSGMEPELDDYLEVDGSEFVRMKGSGIGFDLGLTYERLIPAGNGKPQTLRLSVSATDIGSLGFDTTPGQFTSSGQFDWRGLENDMDFSDVVDSLGNDVYGKIASSDVSGIRVDIMPMINIGASLSSGRWNVMADLGKGLNTRSVNSRQLSGALGIEYSLFGFIPLRAGVRTGGDLHTAWSLGTGIDFSKFEFTLGAMTASNPFQNSVNAGIAWSGFIFRF